MRIIVIGTYCVKTDRDSSLAIHHKHPSFYLRLHYLYTSFIHLLNLVLYTEECVRLTPGFGGPQPNITISNGAT
jgi:hypothetical protein